MPYALIPDGYSLKKVTKLQKQAVNDKRRHDDVLAFLNNPELMKQIMIIIASYIALKEAQDVYDYLAKQGVNISQEVKDEYTKKRTVSGAPVGVSIEDLLKAFPDYVSERIPFL